MNNTENSPLLSLCLSGRNDNYGFNFKRRFVQAMNFLAWSARKAGVEKQIEVVFADWNSEIPLSRVIRLSDGAAKMVRFLEIPPDLAARYNPSFSPFSQSVAFNAALRRAKGAYLGMMPADILLTSYALRNLIGILSGTIPVSFDPRAAVISVPRKNIPFYAEEAHDFSSPERTEALLLAGDAWMLCDNTARGMMGSYGVFILERSLFFSLRGTDERIAGWGYNDIDLALRCADRASVMNMMGYGVWSYDFEPSFRMLVQKEKRRTVFHPIRLGHAENPENWGLADQTLSESRAESGSENLLFNSPRPDTLAWRDWIFWLSQRISPSVVPFFSSCAMLAAWTAAGKTPRMAGTDISKAILRSAARRARGVEWAVASSFHLPVADGTADILLDCFSPLALEEFRRVLKPGGRFLYVVPGPDHLWELKQVLYDRPYPNEEKETPYEGFAYRSIVPVEDAITLPCQADIHALFQMTPYYWKTPKAGAARLATLDTLTTRISFRIHIFQKS